MSLGVFLIASASAINGLLSGLNMDTALVKLPARRRIGAVAYATFARGNDLGNGLVSILHTFATTRAAPVMLSIKDTPDDEAILTAKLDRFARWHTVRATFQVVAFFVLLWALAIM